MHFLCIICYPAHVFYATIASADTRKDFPASSLNSTIHVPEMKLLALHPLDHLACPRLPETKMMALHACT